MTNTIIIVIILEHVHTHVITLIMTLYVISYLLSTQKGLANVCVNCDHIFAAGSIKTQQVIWNYYVSQYSKPQMVDVILHISQFQYKDYRF